MKIVASKRAIKSILSSSDFMSWYDNLSEEDQWKVDDMADTAGIPFYEDASDEELNWLYDQFELKKNISR